MRESEPNASPIVGRSEGHFAESFRFSPQVVGNCCEASCLMLKFPAIGPESRDSYDAQASCLITLE